MPAARLIPAAEARRVPWRNGRGVTEELAIGPSGASFERGDFDWRISKAGVTEPGPFSAFPGFDRVLMVTSGGGLDLDHGGAAPSAHLPPLAPYRFSGDWPTSAALVDGAVTDFNVITRRGAATADVRVLPIDAGRAERIDVAGGESFVHVVSGGAVVTLGVGTTRLSVGESAWFTELLDADRMYEIVASPGPSLVVLTQFTRA